MARHRRRRDRRLARPARVLGGAQAHTDPPDSDTPSGALVYVHGGGFTYGTLDEFEVPMPLIAERAGIIAYAIEYHLASEAKFPVQIDESEYVVRWAFDNGAPEGVDTRKIAVGGDSAGGNMTCVTALKLRDERGPKLAMHVPLFPESAFPGDTLSGVQASHWALSRNEWYLRDGAQLP